MNFTLYTANCCENAKNINYTNGIIITGEDSLKKQSNTTCFSFSKIQEWQTQQ